MKILVATDGSNFSDTAVDKACSLAQEMHDVEFNVVSVYEMPTAVATEPFIGSPIYAQELIDSLKAAADGAAEKATERIRGECPSANVTQSVPMGQPARAILDEAETWGPDLIVVGSHGHGFWGRTLIGSVSDAVVHHAPCSVMVVKPHKGGLIE